MKNYIILVTSLLIFCSCGVGAFFPNANNNYGVQTQVVLDRANYRVVDNVEVVIAVNNSNLKRKDVERSAMGELMRRYKLTGSQAFINVNVEEIDRQNTNLFYVLFGFNFVHHKQYVAARATIIEFLQENGEPIASLSPKRNNEFAVNAVSANQTSVVQGETVLFAESASDVLNRAKKTLGRLKKCTVDDVYNLDKFDKILGTYEVLYARTNAQPTVTAINNLSVATQLVSSILDAKKSPNDINNEIEGEESVDRRIEILVEYAKMPEN